MAQILKSVSLILCLAFPGFQLVQCEILVGLCKVCKCQNTTIMCDRQGFETFPNIIGAPVDMRILDLSFNKISRLDRLEEMENLKSLIFYHNEITALEPNTFEHYTFLDYLDLSQNSIMKVEPLMFKGLENLKVLNLSRNDIRALPNDIFYSMLKLTELRLNGNPLHFIRYEVLAKCINLIRLDLSDIATDFLSYDVFHQLDSLKEIDLSGNNFDVVPNKALRSAINIKIVKLNRNPIHTIDEKSFKRLVNIEVIELQDLQHLETIKAGAFSGLTSLKVLRISNNPTLKTFSMDAISDLYNPVTTRWSLEELSLRGNALETIAFPSEILCKIDVVDLQSNQWKCDCNMHWLNECEIRPELTKDITCAGPAANKGKNLRELSLDEMVCVNTSATEHHQRILRTVVITCGLVGMFVCGIIIVLVLKKRQIKEWWYYKRRGPGAVYYVRAHDNPKEPIEA